MTTNKPAERPIRFNAAMVRATLDGRKTVTRQLVPSWQLPKEISQDCDDSLRWMSIAQRHPRWGFGVFGSTEDECMANYRADYASCCPYGEPGDHLWVRETWAETDRCDGTPVVAFAAGGCVAIGRDGARGPDVLIRNFAWDEAPHVDRWRPSIHMPRWASRIQLEITDVWVERLQEISDDDAMAEGIAPYKSGWTNGLLGPFSSPALAFLDLWESINGPGSWDQNPWVWVVKFRVARS